MGVQYRLNMDKGISEDLYIEKLDMEPLFMLDVYIKEIRSIWSWLCQLGTVVCCKTSSRHRIESVQMVSVSIIWVTGLQESVDMALVTLDLEPLVTRRDQLCKKFANKTLKSRNFSKTFTSTLQETNQPLWVKATILKEPGIKLEFSN